MATEKLFYENVNLTEFRAQVLSCEKNDSYWEVVLDKTAFYPEGGGQPADQGTLDQVKVLYTEEREGTIVHHCSEELIPGTTVEGRIDWERRFDHMQQHSGEHIVSGMICEAFQCDNVGFHMGEDMVTIDYNKVITWEDLMKIEQRANAYIWENHPFEAEYVEGEALRNYTYRSKKEIDGVVRITRFPEADCCACCGTHVPYSGQVGMVKFMSCVKFRDGVRIELLCGRRAYEYLTASWEQNRQIAKDLSVPVTGSHDAFIKLQQELLQSKQKADALEERLIALRAEQYANKGNVLIIEEMAGDMPRKLCDAIADTCGGRCMIFAGSEQAYRYVIIHKGADIKNLVKDLNGALQGRGGGKNGFAQGAVQADAEAIRSFCESL